MVEYKANMDHCEDNKGLHQDMMDLSGHHAHTASVITANGLEGEVICISLDGMGMGEDVKRWGTKIMLADYMNYKRLFHFEFIPHPEEIRQANRPGECLLLTYIKILEKYLLSYRCRY